jgi:hypothetical protein
VIDFLNQSVKDCDDEVLDYLRAGNEPKINKYYFLNVFMAALDLVIKGYTIQVAIGGFKAFLQRVSHLRLPETQKA